MGRHTKAKLWLTEEKLILINGWSRLGFTNEEIAKKMNINASTLYDWKNRYPQIRDALKDGQEIVNFKVLNALLKKALQGDTSAMMFWLKNRMPENFRDATFRALNEAQTEKTKAETEKTRADTEMVKAKTKLLGGHNDVKHQAKLDNYLNQLDQVLDEVINDDKSSEETADTKSDVNTETTDGTTPSVQ